MRNFALSLAGQAEDSDALPIALAALLDAPAVRGLHRCTLTLSSTAPATARALVSAIAAGRLSAPTLVHLDLDLACVHLGDEDAIGAAIEQGGGLGRLPFKGMGGVREKTIR